MHKLILVLSLLVANIFASPIRSIILYPTTIGVLGNSIGNNSVATARCATFKHFACSPTAAVPVLCRFPTINMTTFSLNTTVPVIDSTTNISLATTWSGLFTDKGGGRYLGYTLRFNSTSGQVEYWSGCAADGKSTAITSNCGGDWASNTTGIAGATATDKSSWINFDATAACYETKQHLCACESTAWPIVYQPEGWCKVQGITSNENCTLFVTLLTLGLVFVVFFGGFGLMKWYRGEWKCPRCGK